MTNKDFFIHCWEDEAKTTIKALLALPTDMDKLKYQPNQKARKAIQIIEHILPHAEQLAEATKTFVLAEQMGHYHSIADAVTSYEKNSAYLVKCLKNIDEKTWDEKIVPLVINGNRIYEAPMYNMFWSLLFDTIHHRGQLSMYYRAMGVRNPSIYGPTAEDMEERMATTQEQRNII